MSLLCEPAPSARGRVQAKLWLVRHACAGRKGDGPWSDDDRPLDPVGERQASSLADLLASQRPTALLSSPSRRCVQTLEPLAGRLGVPVLIDPRLRAVAGASALAQLIESADHGVVACTHGEAMKPLISRFDEFGIHRGRSAAGELLLKGAAWALTGAPGQWDLQVLAPLPLTSCPPHDGGQ